MQTPSTSISQDSGNAPEAPKIGPTTVPTRSASSGPLCGLADAAKRLSSTDESVEKVHLISSTSFSGVSLPYPSKRSSIVDRITKPLFLASYEELCSESFSTDSNLSHNPSIRLMSDEWAGVGPRQLSDIGSNRVEMTP